MEFQTTLEDRLSEMQDKVDSYIQNDVIIIFNFVVMERTAKLYSLLL
jgi:hypothetical protein